MENMRFLSKEEAGQLQRGEALVCSPVQPSPPFTKWQCLLFGVVLNGLYFTAIAFLSLPLMCYLFGAPHIVTAVSTVAVSCYYTWVLFLDGSENEYGNPWMWFSKSFWPLDRGRTYHSLEIFVPIALKSEVSLWKSAELVFPDGKRKTVDSLRMKPQEDLSSVVAPTPTSPSIVSSSNSKTVSQAILNLHPHGTLSDFRLIMDGLLDETMCSINSWRVLTARIIFMIPVVREIAIWTHCVDASLKSAEKNIKAGHSLMLTAGGEYEQLLTQRGKETIYITSRKGFVRLAVRYGLPIVPIYVFGANDLHITFPWGFNFRKWCIKKFRVCLLLFIGRYGMMPGPGNLKVVCGPPIWPSEVVSKDNPEFNKIVDELHDRFIDELVSLFDRWRGVFGYGDRELTVL
eukprot:Lankesteria_metandrocarpae@DN5272_c0_g1_i1.p2